MDGPDLTFGFVLWQEFMEKWKMIITLQDPRSKSGQYLLAHIAALSDWCSQLEYPMGWTNLPPNDGDA
ncbi:uncharacterized protein N7498_004015 [Penicillium cinerascens]|uniref:Uncharacterized protein n=1 Tax=Penicillium cinerascens TaxID=70096 RepID=A0A9W9N389_9EURO|nr:uncharacterized protein N7498_004015 [Penicillium cinerascens]KAJ5212369.1 hypothetical protein N7498_004015 [Penicillium cinerascens]